jgi:3',5'-cyclic AMP phosphodiesterase CpdA
MVTMTAVLRPRHIALSLASLVVFAGALAGQVPAPTDSVAALVPPRTPFPSENATASVTRFSFIMYGDTRGRHDGTQLQAEHQLVVESMLSTIKKAAAASDPIRFVVQSGDAIQDGSIAAQTNVSYAPLINRLMQDGDVPYFLAVGNHDVGNAVDLTNARRVAGLRNYFAANAKLIPPEGSPRRLAGYPTYAFGYGNTYFIAVDSDIPDDTAQIAWMRSQLAGVDRRRYPNVAVFFHHPPFSSGPHGGATLERQAASIRAKWMPLFHQYHVRLLLTGHEHLFEHWVERYSDASGAYRIDEIVSGGGGAPLYTYRGEPDVRPYIDENAALKVSLEHLARPSSDPGANPFHYVVVHVDGERFNLEVVGVDWGKGFAPYRSSGASLNDPKPGNP